MSEFRCEVVQIDDVIEHPNADKLTIVKIGGYDCIANKHDDGSWRYNKGDLVVYIPEAAVLPEWILKKMGFWNEEKQCGMLSGSQGNRVKAIKLRGVVSQGILYPVDINYHPESKENLGHFLIREVIYHGDQGLNVCSVTLGEDVSEKLGITKYEPPIPANMRGQITGGLFGYTKSYDIENAQKYPNAFKPDDMIVATEKLHGTLCQIGFLNDSPESIRHELFKVDTFNDENVYGFVTSKGLAKQGIIQKNVEGNKDNVYVSIYNRIIAPKAREIVDRFIQLNQLYYKKYEPITWRLHIFGAGVQDLAYGKQQPEFRVFDVHVRIQKPNQLIEGYLDHLHLTNWCIDLGLQRVPLIYSGPFNSLQFLDQFRSGDTVEGQGKHIREGIVIRPHKEQQFRGLPDNRLQLKYINTDYLLRKGNTTEFQ